MESLIIILKMIPWVNYLLYIGGVIFAIFLISVMSREDTESLIKKIIVFTIWMIFVLLAELSSITNTINEQIADYSETRKGYITVFDLNTSQLKSIYNLNKKRERKIEKENQDIYEAKQETERKEEIQKQKIIKEIK